ncbi:transcriptional regulator, MarR family [Noviherbaspirillum humi]|uniref:Transcriptional regulator, MarR family n=1 Tax=Noviherbaspirillum humi TaxID=1688639 RepID=A0A239KCM3_9BURK|nr:MarR family transcriptional regulator [Noviherbaspirillum humi]SNT16116.1 transcriptional regulator, MarR family [Noviherbaspirillum humi]
MKMSEISVQEQFGIAIGEVSRAWRLNLNKRLKPLGMSQSKWRALRYADRAGDIAQADLAALLGIEAPAVTRLIKQMEQEGWITRQARPDDARVKLVRVTAKARKIIARIDQEVARLRADTVARLPAAEAAAGLRAMLTLQQLLQAL